MILEHLDKNNLHHAYLIEGAREEIIPEILKFLKTLNAKTVGNPDFVNISIDNFKIDEAFNLRAMSADKSFSADKKIFMVCVNNFSLDAQNVLLKMFEEPIESTIFFLVMPDINILLKTLISRFYLISTRQDLVEEKKEAKNFINLSLQSRINFIKELLVEADEKDEEGNEIIVLDSARSKALNFLNALEITLLKTIFDIKVFEHFFKVREFLRVPGSSTKSLMESIALIIPEKI